MVELLTTVAVFSVLAIIVGSVLIQSLRIQRRSFSYQVIQESSLATLELMAKEIRVSDIINQNNNCTTDPILNQLTIIHPINGQVVYSLDAQGIVRRADGSDNYFLSYNEVIFNTLRFCVSGTTTPRDGQSSRVTIIASVSNRVGFERLTVQLQTTITSRIIANEL